MPLSQYDIPSATKTVCLTETELLALQFPSKDAVSKESWKDLPGEELRPCEKLGPGYFITNKGRVQHVITKKSGRLARNEIKGKYYPLTGRVVTVYNPGRIAVRFGRIMLEAFKPMPRSQYLEAVPMDGDNGNLLLENWSWMTKTEARRYRQAIGEEKLKIHSISYQGRYGKVNRAVKYSDHEISEMIRLVDAGISRAKVAKIFDCTSNYITYVMGRKDERKY